jgi:hypothetical protein
MSTGYSEQLAEWVKQKQSRKRDKNRVAFLAVKMDVLDALAAGYAAKTIWLHLLESHRIDFGYDTFLNYTKPLKRNVAKLEESKTEKENPKKEIITETKRPAGFSFNPVPNKEELL